MISEESLLFLAGQLESKTLSQRAVEIGDIIGAGLACAELLEDMGDDAIGDPALIRATAQNFHAACNAFFLKINPNPATP